jgi:predicted nuclease of predicted toxin-antitoxin system
MRFLLDANLPRSAVAAVEKCGHTVEFARDSGLGTAPDDVIAERARATHAVLVTRDLDFADVRRYPPAEYSGIVILRLPDDAMAKDIAAVLARFLADTEVVDQLPRRLATVDETRVRFRPTLEQPVS